MAEFQDRGAPIQGLAVDRRGAKIRIRGIVQGVGFRPFVFGLARRMRLAGWVRNTSAGVDITVDGSRADLESFVQALQEQAPPLAVVDSCEVEFCAPGGFESFEILESEAREGDFIPVSPDVSICEDCRRELWDPGDRRYRYPFINCTNCGPRFTIIRDIPYDRPKTTMASFPMCPECRREYEDPMDRRYHAQPVACPDCGPHVWLEAEGEILAEKEQAIQAARRLLREGKILGIRGLGGFHLACDARNVRAVDELRRRKLRVDKPFGLMATDETAVEAEAELDRTSRELLHSRQRPIVILKRKAGARIAPGVAPGQTTLGFMLPYTPLHELLLEREAGQPDVLVMTSGNLSEEPIATGNQEARERLGPLADAFLMHNREIEIRCDDSVVRGFRNGIYPLRRARGYAPFPLFLRWELPSLLATGAELKNTFCLVRGRYAFLSHHIGDLENFETLRAFEQGICHYQRLFRVEPRLLAYDLHPDYLATRYALDRAEREGLEAVGVQHHHAHIAACMAEHGLEPDRQVIGLAFDGTGYGLDGTVWGGEVLIAGYGSFERAYHLRPFPMPGGDAAVREPWRLGLGLLWSLGEPWEPWIPSMAAAGERRGRILRQQLERGLNTPRTSSLGRLFDAVASLAGVRHEVNYEAQAAMEWEALAGSTASEGYRLEIDGDRIEPAPLVRALLEDIRRGAPIESMAARFHQGLVDAILRLCLSLRKDHSLNEVVLSGGVWQNMRLLHGTVEALLEQGFQVYWHTEVPANDGGLSLGQALVAAAQRGWLA